MIQNFRNFVSSHPFTERGTKQDFSRLSHPSQPILKFHMVYAILFKQWFNLLIYTIQEIRLE